MPEEEKQKTEDIAKICKFKPENIWSKILWIFFSLIIGAVIGFCLSRYQYNEQLEEARLAKIDLWTQSVINEIDYNLKNKFNAPENIQIDTVSSIDRKLTYSSLSSFIEHLPEFGKQNSDLLDKGQILLENIKLLNKLLDDRDMQVNKLMSIKIRNSSGFNLINEMKNTETQIIELKKIINFILMKEETLASDFKQELGKLRNSYRL